MTERERAILLWIAHAVAANVILYIARLPVTDTWERPGYEYVGWG